MMGIFISLIVVMISQMYTGIKTHKTDHIKCVQFITY